MKDKCILASFSSGGSRRYCNSLLFLPAVHHGFFCVPVGAIAVYAPDPAHFAFDKTVSVYPM
jgi:hypothetical protein